MPHDMDNKQLKEWGDNYLEVPKDNVWDKIEKKLDTTEVKGYRRFISWKTWAIAANIALVIAFIIGFSDFVNNHKKASFTLNINQKPLNLEIITEEKADIDLYSIENIRNFKKVYASKEI